jgi:beta-phosphoglucomutase-like phosphatase (HAD superfamily)
MNLQPMFLFDFDGVLINSLDEIALSAYNYATGESIYHTSELPAEYLDRFKANRHLLLSPARLGELAKWCLASDKVLSREEFLKSLPSDRETLAKLGDQFFATRQRFIEAEPELWLNANPPFQTIWQRVCELSADQFAILTYKNRAAVYLLCKHYGLATESIYSGEGGRTKTENILALDARYGANKYIFLDDALENLVALTPVLPGRIEAVLANWGYCSGDDIAEAQSLGIQIMTEAEFVTTYL